MHFEINLDFKATHEFTSKIKVDFNLDFKAQFWHIFENNLDFKATHEFYHDFKSTLILKKNSSDAFSKQPRFQGNVNYPLVGSEESVNIILFNDSLERFF